MKIALVISALIFLVCSVVLFRDFRRKKLSKATESFFSVIGSGAAIVLASILLNVEV